MKRIFLIVMILYSVNIYAEIIYPDDYYIIDTENDFRIVLGNAPSFVSDFYGAPLSKELIFEAKWPEYKIWREGYKCGITIEYETYDFMITYIHIDNNRFITSKGVKVGTSKEEVIQLYGEPTREIKEEDSKNKIYMLYEEVNKEINIDGEYSLIGFIIVNNTVSDIVIEIVSSV
jgi:hypothetical protein